MSRKLNSMDLFLILVGVVLVFSGSFLLGYNTRINQENLEQKGRVNCEEYTLLCNSKCVDTLKDGNFTYFHHIQYNDTTEKGLYYGSKLNNQQIMRCCENVR